INDIITQNFNVTAPSAQYDAQHRRLTVFFQPGVSTAAQLASAVNVLLNSPLEAALSQQRNDGSGTLSAKTFEGVTSDGAATKRSAGAIFPAGDNNAIT